FTLTVYNNTFVKNYCNIHNARVGETGTRIFKNNLCQDNSGGGDYSDTGGGFGTTANNISEDATSPDASFRNKTVSFVDEDNDDFHLAGNDANARNAGEDLSATFTDDIDGQTRGYRGWDIGADETFTSTMIDAPLTNKMTDGLVGHWTFNGGDMDWSSTTAEVLDRSGNSNNGNVTNFGQEAVTGGISGQALGFDGVDDIISVSSASGLPNTIGSVSFWLYPRSIGVQDESYWAIYNDPIEDVFQLYTS
ncbi:unnamed protein product, partial [marine sediment metagenome]